MRRTETDSDVFEKSVRELAQENLVSCGICGRPFPSERAMKIHKNDQHERE
ncbi:hypothetical protein [Halorubrum sp. C191]|uniref:hypothetical protein n=1 Tax=Halorubrum sp. C191 TaxID=1383842 RepID=UPI0011819E37